MGIEKKEEEQARRERKRKRMGRERSNFSFSMVDSERGVASGGPMSAEEEEGGNVPHAVNVCSIIFLILSELLEWLNIYYRMLQFHHDYLVSDEEAPDGHVRSVCPFRSVFSSYLIFVLSPKSLFIVCLLSLSPSFALVLPTPRFGFSLSHVVNRIRISSIILSRDWALNRKCRISTRLYFIYYLS